MTRKTENQEGAMRPLTDVMRKALAQYALNEVDAENRLDPRVHVTSGTIVALIERGLLTYGRVHELTKLGYETAAERLPWFHAWMNTPDGQAKYAEAPDDPAGGGIGEPEIDADAADELVADMDDRGEEQPDGSVRVTYGDQPDTVGGALAKLSREGQLPRLPDGGESTTTEPAEVQWNGRTFGELTPAEQRTAAAQAGRKLGAELKHTGPALLAQADKVIAAEQEVGLRCELLVPAGGSCANGGLSNRPEVRNVILLDAALAGMTAQMKRAGHFPVRLWEPTEDCPAVRLGETMPGYIVAQPVDWPAGAIGPMASGAYIVSRDERFAKLVGGGRPVPLHDRFETTAQYRALSSD